MCRPTRCKLTETGQRWVSEMKRREIKNKTKVVRPWILNCKLYSTKYMVRRDVHNGIEFTLTCLPAGVTSIAVMALFSLFVRQRWYSCVHACVHTLVMGGARLRTCWFAHMSPCVPMFSNGRHVASSCQI